MRAYGHWEAVEATSTIVCRQKFLTEGVSDPLPTTIPQQVISKLIVYCLWEGTEPNGPLMAREENPTF